MLITIVILIATMVVAYLLFVNFYPSFGGNVSKADKERYSLSENHREGAFVNKNRVPEDMSFGEMLKVARKFFFEKVPNARPENNLEVQKIDSSAIADYNSPTRLIWFGHSSFLLQMEDKTILIDPMLDEVPAPHPMLGSKRFNSEAPIALEMIPAIDAVIISHDHYDHLDYKSIKELKDRVEMFYVPLGVGVHLQAWDVPEDRILELDWWQEVEFKGLTFACTPAQHFSGRKFNNRMSTLWSSWVILSDKERLFFSGDSGYSEHFKDIGNAYGPFDFAMMECGQYNEKWPDIHMFPEETAQAGLDVRAQAIMPIHWGAFKLALHEWTDPIIRVQKKASELGIPLVTPRIGEPIIINDLPKPQSEWWMEN
ncbi:MBL fold metallo-hydrolase [Aureitalea sp. L0-47]|nr:MBL fold metallo-hydrolase [Aureitalea sp. L0-47]